MALEAITSSNGLLNMMVFYDTTFLLDDKCLPYQADSYRHDGCASTSQGVTAVSGGLNVALETVAENRQGKLAMRGKKRRKRRPRTCKNEEAAETQRMTHIVVERNRRKQMNERLAVLRCLMPESYAQRGDQASIVGGAITYVKELEHLLQSLEAQKLQISGGSCISDSPMPFSGFFTRLDEGICEAQPLGRYLSRSTSSMDDIEVTLIEMHANLRILSRHRPRHLVKLVAGIQALHLSILHLNVSTLDPLVLYSVNAKVEEDCLLTSVDDIIEAVHHMLRVNEQQDAAAAPSFHPLLSNKDYPITSTICLPHPV
ncbi:hypothetical protein Droror1_Dr00026628 [Drosera rotundifolia]